MSSARFQNAPDAPDAIVAQGKGMRVEWWGRVDYTRGLALQESALEARRLPGSIDRLILLEHPEVITCGRSSHDEHVLASAGIEVVQVRRGGDVTYHAPGQLVGYFIHDLRAQGEIDLHRHMRALEGGLIDALSQLAVAAERIDGTTGVFVSQSPGEAKASRPPPRRKIASIGIGVRRWITYHGFALNVRVDLSGFDRIVPCGLHDVRMTSVCRELDIATARDDSSLDLRAREAVAAAYLSRFD